ncbi:hypothetical protein BMS3Abin10_00324 [bacterium BMS3Abin10]|nr:hypothetical protein BMS3Abin10_00324 [bacterium BMS3Abin10]GBE40127.1 hypothetical protein BMS3Bbin08_02765 [bacterium BMS3Bbin08]
MNVNSKKGERPLPNQAKVVTQKELKDILRDPRRYHEGMGRWAEDVIIRAYLDNPDWQILYRENSPLHHGFDFMAKHIPSGQVVVAEMKMSNKVGRLRTYLKKTKTKGRQMSLKWIKKTAQEIKKQHPLAYQELINAMNKGLLRRTLCIANHEKRPKGWLSASMGKMGMKGFFEDDFKKTSGFGLK